MELDSKIAFRGHNAKEIFFIQMGRVEKVTGGLLQEIMSVLCSVVPYKALTCHSLIMLHIAQMCHSPEFEQGEQLLVRVTISDITE